MDKGKDFKLKQFLDISRQMLAFAKNNNWEKLPDLENDRNKIMRSVFKGKNSVSNSPSNAHGIEQTIKNVLSINDKIEQLAQQQKVTISRQLHGLKKKQNVHSAYLQNK